MEFGQVFLLTITPQDRFDHLVQYFQNPTSRGLENHYWLGLLIVVGMVLAVWLAERFLFSRRRKPNRPWGLFFALCRRHRLTKAERWLLWNLARSRTPEAPARVFLDPELFSPDQLPTVLASKTATLLGLRARLFGDLLETSSEKGRVSEEQEKAPEPDSGETPLGEPSPSLGFPTVQSPSLDLPPWNPMPNKVVGNI